MRDRCYCCNAPATTIEHVPPKCLFPEQKDLPPSVDMRRNLITVPSCAEHNLQKSRDDEYLLYVLTMNLPAERIAQDHFFTKTARAIKRRSSLAEHILASATSVVLHDERSNAIFETLAVPVEARLEAALEKVALGLYRHHFDKSWSGSLRVAPEFHHFPDETWNQGLQQASAFADMLFAETTLHGENPLIFKYQVATNEAGVTAVRMHFYGGCKVLAIYGHEDSKDII